jgi:hypothetical protein
VLGTDNKKRGENRKKERGKRKGKKEKKEGWGFIRYDSLE